MERVQQQDDFSCGVACVAMVTGRSFEEVAKDHGVRQGMCAEDMDALLVLYGMAFERQLYPTLKPGSTYIVTVPSLNRVGGLHFIVVRTKEFTDATSLSADILDPQYGRADNYEEFLLTSWAEAVRILNPA